MRGRRLRRRAAQYVAVARVAPSRLAFGRCDRALAHHPDRHGDPAAKAAAEATMARVNDARDVLCDAAARAAYDRDHPA